jgi:hypothetical protein
VTYHQKRYQRDQRPGAGAEIKITGPNGCTKTVVFSANGYYEMGDLEPGDYTARLTGTGLSPGLEYLRGSVVTVKVLGNSIATAEFPLAK